MRERQSRVPVLRVESQETVETAEPDDSAETVDDYAQAPVGPSDGEEITYQDDAFNHAPLLLDSEAEEPGGDAELPPLEELVKRIPTATLTAMDELFRAKFVRVRQIPKKHLKKS